MTSLTDVPNYGGYYPFHVMDKMVSWAFMLIMDTTRIFPRSMLQTPIYYASRDWNDKWGGEP